MSSYDLRPKKLGLPLEETARTTISSAPEIPFEEIVSATNDFSHKNLIHKDLSYDVYYGRLSGSGPLGNIILRSTRETYYEFRREWEDTEWEHFLYASRLGRKPTVVGYCDDIIIVYEHIGKGILKKDVRDPTFNWSERIETCIDIRNEIGWIFGLWEIVPMICLYNLMFELLCKTSEEHSATLLMAIKHYRRKELEKIIHPHLIFQMGYKSFTAFSTTMYEGTTGTGGGIFSISDNIVERGLHRALQHQKSFESYLERIKIELKDIMLSTNNFAEEYLIRSETYGTVYKAKLDHFDRKSGSIIRDTTVVIKCISRREDKQDDQGFFTELHMLVSCEHHNIQSLIGFCHEGSKRILVYKYAQSLDEYLGNTDNKIILTWGQRIHICLDVAHGLNYLHKNTFDKSSIIHGNIKSANILLGENGKAMIANFGVSTYHQVKQQASTIESKIMASTSEYLDPEYERTGKLEYKSDIYSFGIVLFEILSGRLANDSLYLAENDKGLAPIARRHFNDGTLNKLVDPNIKKEAEEFNQFLYFGAIHDSLNIFSKIAYQCLAETQAERPSMEDIIKELLNASNFQGKLEPFKIQLITIMESTNNFSQEQCIGSGTYGTVYIAELDYVDKKSLLVRKDMVAIKHIHDSQDGTSDQGFSKELSMLGGCEHPNIISVLGFCVESSMRILVYEYARKGSLSQHLESTDSKSILTWIQRIQICLDIANGLDYLHNNTKGKPRIIHRDIKSDNILLDEKWNAKIADFGLFKFHSSSQENSIIKTNNIAGTSVYLDPEYNRTFELRSESDIYSFGVVLFEVLSGSLAYDKVYLRKNVNGIAPIARKNFRKGTINDMVDSQIKTADGPNQESIDTFSKIAYRCLAKSHEERPTIEDIIKELQRALNSQMEHSSSGGMCSNSTEEQVSNIIGSTSNDNGVGGHGDTHVDRSEDNTASSLKRLDDVPVDPGHDGEGIVEVRDTMELEVKLDAERAQTAELKETIVAERARTIEQEERMEAERARTVELAEKMEADQAQNLELEERIEADRARIAKLEERIMVDQARIAELEMRIMADQARTTELEETIVAERARTTELKERIVYLEARNRA